MQDFLNNLTLFPYTFIVGLSLAAACSLLSVFIVLRKMAMIAESIAHAGIGGIAVALLLGVYFPIFNHPVMIQLVTGVFCPGAFDAKAPPAGCTRDRITLVKVPR